MLQIIGKGGMAREIAAYMKKLTGMDTTMGEFEEIETFYESVKTVIAIGDGNARKGISEKYPRFNYISLQLGELCDAEFREGCLFCPGSNITTNVTFGKHVIVNNNATVAHDCVIGDYTTIAPGANISGNVTIGELCYIGTGAVIREKITICDNVMIGAGAVVVKDITEPGTYVGNPCKKIK